ncbi:cleavage polyadenylation factor subunit [Starmerella bacillaris]|uniref:Pre-mRNA polyadenylation factor FIP1 n=1 Tax=Starmerella bacillaris TaxID=1247836 RepID=A0AAV5RH43_STABA|nr:cleavage polyadenylation factor subunit [Starmerella bacillaris]
MAPEVGAKRRADEEESDVDSDSDIEFLLAPRANEPSSSTSDIRASEPAKVEASSNALVNENDANETMNSGIANEENSTEAKNAEIDTNVNAEGSGNYEPPRGTLDIDAVGTLNGQSIAKFPPSSFTDKPWRRPGADISDYFNYGFDEFSWMAYCNRQDKLRAHFTTPQVMNMGMPMMPPQFMMPPPMMPPYMNMNMGP